MFASHPPHNINSDIVFLVFYIIALGLALHRFRWAPGLLPAVLHAAIQIAALSSRLYWHNGDNVSVDLVFGELRQTSTFSSLPFLLLPRPLI